MISLTQAIWTAVYILDWGMFPAPSKMMKGFLRTTKLYEAKSISRSPYQTRVTIQIV